MSVGDLVLTHSCFCETMITHRLFFGYNKRFCITWKDEGPFPNGCLSGFTNGNRMFNVVRGAAQLSYWEGDDPESIAPLLLKHLDAIAKKDFGDLTAEEMVTPLPWEEEAFYDGSLSTQQIACRQFPDHPYKVTACDEEMVDEEIVVYNFRTLSWE